MIVLRRSMLWAESHISAIGVGLRSQSTMILSVCFDHLGLAGNRLARFSPSLDIHAAEDGAAQLSIKQAIGIGKLRHTRLIEQLQLFGS